MIREKWLNYAVDVLKSCDSGAKSIKALSEDIGGSSSYIAKVVASLRNGHLINDRYELSKPIEQITIKEILEILLPEYQPAGKVSDNVFKLVLASLEISITQVW